VRVGNIVITNANKEKQIKFLLDISNNNNNNCNYDNSNLIRE
jgi:hypothetical protein